MASLAYVLCSVTALLCAVLLLRAYRQTRNPILWWSGLCFCGLMLSNFVLVVDKLFLSAVDLQPLRALLTLAAMGLMIYGLINRSE